MWKPQEGKNLNTTHQKEGSQIVIPKRCSNKDWSSAPCVRGQAAASLSQNLNTRNQVSDLVALNMHSKTSAVSLILNYQIYCLELSLDFAPPCGAWTCPCDHSHPWWEEPLSAAIPIQVWSGGNTPAYGHPPARQPGQRNEASLCSDSHWCETTVKPLKCVELKLCKADLELWSSTTHRVTEMELEWPSTAAASFMKRFPANWSRGLGEDLPTQHSSSHAACSMHDRDGIWLKIFICCIVGWTKKTSAV